MFNFVAHENVDHSVQTISERSSRVLWTKAIVTKENASSARRQS